MTDFAGANRWMLSLRKQTHTHTKVKEKQQTWWTLVQRDMLPGEGREGACNPIQLSVLVLDCLLLLYMAHVIYSIQVIFNPYYVTRWNQTYGKFRDISGCLAFQAPTSTLPGVPTYLIFGLDATRDFAYLLFFVPPWYNNAGREKAKKDCVQ